MVFTLRRPSLAALGCIAALGAAVAACGDDEDEPSAGGDGGAAAASADCNPDAALRELASGKVLSKGPYGEPAVPASEVSLTDEELAQIKEKGATAALVMHFGGNDWTNAQVAGAKEQFAKMGVEVIAVTQADGKADKQVADLETVMAKKPDVILSIPIDPTATASAYRKAVEAGTKIVFLDLPAKDMKPGDYVSVVSADNYGNGVASAHILAKAIECEGEVGAVHFADASSYAVQQRWQAFQDTLKKDYPGMSIVESQEVNAPDFAGDAEKGASAILTKHPDTKGMWAFFDVPAEGVKQAAAANGTPELPIATVDLGLNVAIDIAEGDGVVGLGAQLPFDQGVTEAILAGYALLDKEAPPYVALPPLPVEKDNVLEAWEQVYHSAPPEQLTAAAGG
jgi:ribose transport system substrate-binding protein